MSWGKLEQVQRLREYELAVQQQAAALSEEEVLQRIRQQSYDREYQAQLNLGAPKWYAERQANLAAQQDVEEYRYYSNPDKYNWWYSFGRGIGTFVTGIADLIATLAGSSIDQMQRMSTGIHAAATGNFDKWLRYNWLAIATPVAGAYQSFLKPSAAGAMPFPYGTLASIDLDKMNEELEKSQQELADSLGIPKEQTFHAPGVWPFFMGIQNEFRALFRMRTLRASEDMHPAGMALSMVPGLLAPPARLSASALKAAGLAQPIIRESENVAEDLGFTLSMVADRIPGWLSKGTKWTVGKVKAGARRLSARRQLVVDLGEAVRIRTPEGEWQEIPKSAFVAEETDSGEPIGWLVGTGAWFVDAAEGSGARMARKLGESKGGRMFGAWTDEGKLYIDNTLFFDDWEEAREVGNAYNQKAAWEIHGIRAKFDVSGNPEVIAQQLTDAGINYFTLQEIGKRKWRVWVFDGVGRDFDFQEGRPLGWKNLHPRYHPVNSFPGVPDGVVLGHEGDNGFLLFQSQMDADAYFASRRKFWTRWFKHRVREAEREARRNRRNRGDDEPPTEGPSAGGVPPRDDSGGPGSGSGGGAPGVDDEGPLTMTERERAALADEDISDFAFSVERSVEEFRRAAESRGGAPRYDPDALPDEYSIPWGGPAGDILMYSWNFFEGPELVERTPFFLKVNPERVAFLHWNDLPDALRRLDPVAQDSNAALTWLNVQGIINSHPEIIGADVLVVDMPDGSTTVVPLRPENITIGRNPEFKFEPLPQIGALLDSLGFTPDNPAMYRLREIMAAMISARAHQWAADTGKSPVEYINGLSGELARANRKYVVGWHAAAVEELYNRVPENRVLQPWEVPYELKEFYLELGGPNANVTRDALIARAHTNADFNWGQRPGPVEINLETLDYEAVGEISEAIRARSSTSLWRAAYTYGSQAFREILMYLYSRADDATKAYIRDEILGQPFVEMGTLEGETDIFARYGPWLDDPRYVVVHATHRGALQVVMTEAIRNGAEGIVVPKALHGDEIAAMQKAGHLESVTPVWYTINGQEYVVIKPSLDGWLNAANKTTRATAIFNSKKIHGLYDALRRRIIGLEGGWDVVAFLHEWAHDLFNPENLNPAVVREIEAIINEVPGSRRWYERTARDFVSYMTNNRTHARVRAHPELADIKTEIAEVARDILGFAVKKTGTPAMHAMIEKIAFGGIDVELLRLANLYDSLWDSGDILDSLWYSNLESVGEMLEVPERMPEEVTGEGEVFYYNASTPYGWFTYDSTTTPDTPFQYTSYKPLKFYSWDEFVRWVNEQDKDNAAASYWVRSFLRGGLQMIEATRGYDAIVIYDGKHVMVRPLRRAIEPRNFDPSVYEAVRRRARELLGSVLLPDEVEETYSQHPTPNTRLTLRAYRAPAEPFFEAAVELLAQRAMTWAWENGGDPLEYIAGLRVRELRNMDVLMEPPTGRVARALLQHSMLRKGGRVRRSELVRYLEGKVSKEDLVFSGLQDMLESLGDDSDVSLEELLYHIQRNRRVLFYEDYGIGRMPRGLKPTKSSSVRYAQNKRALERVFNEDFPQQHGIYLEYDDREVIMERIFKYRKRGKTSAQHSYPQYHDAYSIGPPGKTEERVWAIRGERIPHLGDQHFSVPSYSDMVVGHARFFVEGDSLFVEEIQSDLHQTSERAVMRVFRGVVPLEKWETYIARQMVLEAARRGLKEVRFHGGWATWWVVMNHDGAPQMWMRHNQRLQSIAKDLRKLGFEVEFDVATVVEYAAGNTDIPLQDLRVKISDGALQKLIENEPDSMWSLKGRYKPSERAIELMRSGDALTLLHEVIHDVMNPKNLTPLQQRFLEMYYGKSEFWGRGTHERMATDVLHFLTASRHVPGARQVFQILADAINDMWVPSGYRFVQQGSDYIETYVEPRSISRKTTNLESFVHGLLVEITERELNVPNDVNNP